MISKIYAYHGNDIITHSMYARVTNESKLFHSTRLTVEVKNIIAT